MFSYKRVFYYEGMTYEEGGLYLLKYLFTRFVSTPGNNSVVARERAFGLIATNYTNRTISPLKKAPGRRREKKNPEEKKQGRRGKRNE